MESPSEIPVSANTQDVATWIWRNLVPKSGQCGTVQGELLRAVEKLCWEAQNNGNVNWDSEFEMLIDFLDQKHCEDPQVTDSTKATIHEDLNMLREFDSPYTDEDLYDRLREAVVGYCQSHPQFIAKAKNPLLHR